MEKELNKKYYDIIVDLIQNHHKFSGYETILEDIAQDAYEHAKIIIDTVTNEDVIQAYLSKVVSTSIITVPKKMNISKRKQTNLDEIFQKKSSNAINTEISTQEPLDFELDEDIYQEEAVLEINEKSEATETLQDLPTEIHDFQEEELTQSSPELLEEIVENTALNEVLNEDYREQNEAISEEETPIKNTLAAEESLENVLTENEVDLSLVDKMINGIKEDFEEEKIENQEFEIEDLETLTDNTGIKTPDIELDDNTFTVNNEISYEESPEEINKLNTFEVEIEEELLEEIKDIEEIDSLQNFDNDTFLIEEEVNDALCDTIKDTITESQSSDSANIENKFIPSIYQSFEYEPNKKEIPFKDEISKLLIETNEKLPDLKILDVCDLKFNKNLPVSEIAKVLNIDIDCVLESLNEITEIFKD